MWQFAPSSSDDVRTWPVWDPLRPHVVQAIQRAEEEGVPASASALMNELAVLLSAKGLHAEAVPLSRRALELAEVALGRDHPTVAILLNNLGQLLQNANRLSEAEPLMRRALAIDEASFGPDHPNVARDLNNLSGLLLETNRLWEAKPMMKRAVAIYEKSLDMDHPRTQNARRMEFLLAELGSEHES